MVGKKDKSIDKEKWLERYMSMSLPLKRIKVTSPFGMRKDPFTGKLRMHNGIDLHARNDEVYAMFPGVVKKVGYDKRKHPIKYTNNNGCNSFVRVCSHCCYNSGNHCYFSICVVRVATVHHMMHSAYMASLQ